MDFIDSSVLPQSYHHLELIRYLLILTFVLFVPYLTLLIGSLGYSLWFDKKAKKQDNADFALLSKKVIDFVTPTRTLPFALGIIPLLSSLFGYAQLLHMNSGIILSGMIFTLFSFALGLFFTYKYKSELHYRDILKSKIDSDDKNILTDVDELFQDTGSYRKHGKYSFAFLIITAIFFSGAVSEALYVETIPSSTNIFFLLFRAGSWLNLFLYLSVSLAIGTAAIAFVIKNKLPGGISTDSINIKSLFGTGIVSTIVSLVFLTLGMFAYPDKAVNAFSFLMFLLCVFTVLVLLNLFYIMIKESSYRLSTSLFYIFFLFILLFIVKDNAAFGTSARDEFYSMNKQYEKQQAELLASMGVETVKISGEDIYNGKCIACHSFDQKVVGPAYNNVLPKYEGKIDDLVKYILNPRKVDPAFPSMPNQGLKPNEARAIADYIMSVHMKNKG